MLLLYKFQNNISLLLIFRSWLTSVQSAVWTNAYAPFEVMFDPAGVNDVLRVTPIKSHFLTYFLTFYLAVAFYLKYFLTFDLVFYLVYLRRFCVVEVRRGTLWSCACSWCPRRRRRRRRKRRDITSNNPHLTGGEKSSKDQTRNSQKSAPDL